MKEELKDEKIPNFQVLTLLPQIVYLRQNLNLNKRKKLLKAKIK